MPGDDVRGLGTVASRPGHGGGVDDAVEVGGADVPGGQGGFAERDALVVARRRRAKVSPRTSLPISRRRLVARRKRAEP
jgi:hypothetical protein